MNIRFLFSFLCLFSLPSLNAQNDYLQEVMLKPDTSSYYYVKTKTDPKVKYDTLAQPNFWERIMSMSEDSCLINVAATREVLLKVSFIKWKKQTEPEKEVYRDSVRKMFNLHEDTKLYVTYGKRNYYRLEKIIPGIRKAVEIFKNEGVDPWFAQTILLVESPSHINYSSVGAYGHFQLMRHIALKQGLIINDTLDEREDFKKSALATARFLKNVCIPEARLLIKRHNLPWNPEKLWVQLVILHIYHAGTANVAAVLKKIAPETGGLNLIQKMWVTEAANFKNASQNYSQLALATNIKLEKIMTRNCFYQYNCQN